MKRSTWINLCFFGSIIAVAGAVIMRTISDPAGGGGPSGDSLVLISPIFFAMAAKKATRWPKAAVFMGTIGLLFAVGALVAVLQGGGPPPR